MERPVLWLHGEIKSPPFSDAARVKAGELLRQLQIGKSISMPHSRPMPGIWKQCHELRIVDVDNTWRVIYVIDQSAILILDVFAKKTNTTPLHVIRACQRRIVDYYSDWT